MEGLRRVKYLKHTTTGMGNWILVWLISEVPRPVLIKFRSVRTFCDWVVGKSLRKRERRRVTSLTFQLLRVSKRVSMPHRFIEVRRVTPSSYRRPIYKMKDSFHDTNSLFDRQRPRKGKEGRNFRQHYWLRPLRCNIDTPWFVFLSHLLPFVNTGTIDWSRPWRMKTWRRFIYHLQEYRIWNLVTILLKDTEL